MSENLTENTRRTLALEHFTNLKNGTTMPRIHAMALNALLTKIQPLETDADYQKLFGVTRGEFSAVVNPHATPAP